MSTTEKPMLYLVALRSSDEQRAAQVGASLDDLSSHYWSPCDNVWVVESAHHAVFLRDRREQRLAADDAVLVALLAGHAAWHGFDRETEDWLLRHL